MNQHDATGWYCIRSRPRQEALAARMLRELDGVEVFCPQIRFRRRTRRGPVWFEEALFPSYLFARFDYETMLRAVKYSHGVTGLVHFGERVAQVEHPLIAALREEFGGGEIREIRPLPHTGEQVEICEGSLKGLKVLVTAVLPAEERIKVLFELIEGIPVEMELGALEIHPNRSVREALCG
jgi:transcriptional antiterminator RfaH